MGSGTCGACHREGVLWGGDSQSWVRVLWSDCPVISVPASALGWRGRVLPPVRGAGVWIPGPPLPARFAVLHSELSAFSVAGPKMTGVGGEAAGSAQGRELPLGLAVGLAVESLGVQAAGGADISRRDARRCSGSDWDCWPGWAG